MCRRTSCEKCGKVTWAGCGAHVDAVMAGVPQKDRCTCARGKPTSSPNDKTTSALNEGPVDRIGRVVAGTAITSLALAGPHSAWGWLGLIPLITGVVGFCPLYRLFGFSTARRA